MSNFHITVATKKSIIDPILTLDSLEESNPNAHRQIHLFGKNSRGLSEVYNEVINAESKNAIFLFVHDDVVIHEGALKEKLEKAHETWDVVGLAGTASFKVQKPSLWHLNDREKFSGAVAHDIDGKNFMTYFGPWNRECVVVDGVFISVHGRAFKKCPELRFDPQFKFHHYDLDFCLQCKKLGLKVGTFPIYLTHHSGGLKSYDKSFKESENRFIKKWGFSVSR